MVDRFRPECVVPKFGGFLIFCILLLAVSAPTAWFAVRVVDSYRARRGAPPAGLCILASSTLALALAIYCGLPVVMRTRPPFVDAHSATTRLGYADIRPIIQQRCLACHSRNPSGGSPVAPMGLRLDTYSDLKYTSYQVRPLAVASQIMPPGNVTEMTIRERAMLGEWIDGGAPE